MESSSNECVFRTVLESCSIQKQLAPTCITEKQSQKIIACSKERKDNLYKDFEKDSVYHKNCYATYTSKEEITKYLNKQAQIHVVPGPRKCNSKNYTEFFFLTQKF